MPMKGSMTEAEYWRDYELVREEVHVAIGCFYSWLEIHNFAAGNKAAFLKLNEHPDFWNLQLYSLQLTFFIALGRIFDDGSDAHSIHKLLAATVAHPEFFSKESLGKRKMQGKKKSNWLDAYLDEVFEPSVADLRVLKKTAAQHKKKFDSAYRDIRNYVFAHRILKDKEKVSQLFGKTKIQDINDILYFLDDILEAIWQLFQNGREPALGVENFDQKDRVTDATRNFLRSMLPEKDQGITKRSSRTRTTTASAG